MATAKPASWINRIIETLKPSLPGDFYGQVVVHVQAGGITHVNVVQSFKPDGRSGR